MYLLLVYISLALVFSFLCSIAEAALLSVTPSYIQSLVQKRKRAGDLLRRLKSDVDRPLAAILSLNTIAHTVGAAGAGAQAAVVFGSEYVGLASAVLTLMILVFSEIIPKTLGAVYWRQLAPPLAFGIEALIWGLYPFVFLSERLTRLLSRGRARAVFSREEFMAMAELGAQYGELEAKESRILKNLLRFHSLKVDDIMTPRTVVFALHENMTVGEVLKKHPDIQFSRIPIYHKNLDDISGFVLKNEIYFAQAKGLQDKALHEFKRELKAIPESATLSQLFEFLLDNREHILLVVDEYGGVAGIVTLEDVVETLLGLEIVDEADKTVDMRQLARAQWEKRARRLGILTEETEEPHGGDHDAGS